MQAATPRCRSWIKIDVTGPLDRAELVVHCDSLEDLAVVANRRKHAAGLKQTGEINLVHSAVGERQRYPALRERLDLGMVGRDAFMAAVRSALAAQEPELASNWRPARRDGSRPILAPSVALDRARRREGPRRSRS